MHERIFKPSEVQKLEDPERLKWLPPGDVIKALSLRPGMVVADIGAGSGYFAIPIAHAVAPEEGSGSQAAGHVFAVDMQEEMLAILRQKLAQPGMPDSVRLVHGSAAETKLPGASCDVVLLANVWHELEKPDEAAREAARILRTGGTLAILDWRPDVTRPPGPPLEHRISPQSVKGTLGMDGWSCLHSASVGDYSYLLVFRRLE
jgi:ubiquinone/menaquinone biosynthesis C-methylase UbiE